MTTMFPEASKMIKQTTKPCRLLVEVYDIPGLEIVVVGDVRDDVWDTLILLEKYYKDQGKTIGWHYHD